MVDGNRKVGILGAGRMGIGLAVAWAAQGWDVVLGSRNPEALAERLPVGTGVRPAGYAEAVRVPVVVFATPWSVTADLVRAEAEALADRILIDITNPFGQAPPGVSGIAVHQAALGRPARWAVAFKTNFWSTIGSQDGVLRQCLIAADDEGARAVAVALAVAAGFAPLDCGGLDAALALDGMVPLMIELDRRAGGGHRSHWHFATTSGA